MPTISTQYCKRCNKTKNIELFKKKHRILKCCLPCRETATLQRRSKKCSHNREMGTCIPCGGSQMCSHGKRKSVCKDCGDGGGLCSHNIQRGNCRECGINECEHNNLRYRCKKCNDAMKLTIQVMWKGSKKSDRKNNKYNPDEFVDKEYIRGIIVECEDKCYYCLCELQYVEFQSNLATIERLDNNIGHNRGNCVIACRTCNISMVGQR